MLYGPSHERAKETEANGTVSYNFNPRLDSGLHADYRVKANGDKAYVNYIYAGNRPVGTYTINWAAASNTTSYDLKYFHLDGQGSIIAITNSVGAVVERLSYDAWGKRRNANGTDDLSNALVSSSTDHGYTGHEHLDDMGLIHMNGRVYDPRTGRFLQADPTIQSPGNLQSFNRYSYVMNNPFFYTDPSGFSWLGDRWHALTGTNWADSRDQYVKPIVAAVASYYLGPLVSGYFQGGILGGVMGGAATGFVSGGIMGGTLNSAMQGAQAGAITGGLFGAAGGIGKADSFARYAAHAAAGCVNGSIAGSGCGRGAVSAVAGKWTTNATDGNFVMTVVAGGTVSVLGGGKFGNGAVTAAFGYLFNYCGNGCPNEKYTTSEERDSGRLVERPIGDEQELLELPLAGVKIKGMEFSLDVKVTKQDYGQFEVIDQVKVERWSLTDARTGREFPNGAPRERYIGNKSGSDMILNLCFNDTCIAPGRK